MKIKDPFHPGEVKIQEDLNERETALLNGRLYEDVVMAPAHKFLSQLQYFILSTEDLNKTIPVSILFGAPGFISVDTTGKILTFDLSAHKNKSIDPVLSIITNESLVGGLAIELSTRRRLRINGKVILISNDKLMIEVAESYPNCPKYIQKRTVEISDNVHGETAKTDGDLIDPLRDILKNADTFFVSSLNPDGLADASHRGGPKGFIEIAENNTLRIPDYSGNSLYNTFGNFSLNSQAGIVVWDFDSSCFIHLFGVATLEFGIQDEMHKTGGTGRWWSFKVNYWIKQSVVLPFSLKFIEQSPFNP